MQSRFLLSSLLVAARTFVTFCSKRTDTRSLSHTHTHRRLDPPSSLFRRSSCPSLLSSLRLRLRLRERERSAFSPQLDCPLANCTHTLPTLLPPSSLLFPCLSPRVCCCCCCLLGIRDSSQLAVAGALTATTRQPEALRHHPLSHEARGASRCFLSLLFASSTSSAALLSPSLPFSLLLLVFQSPLPRESREDGENDGHRE